MSKTKVKAKAKPKAKSLYGADDAAIRAELRRVRVSAGLSQAALAANFGRFQSFVSTAERSDGIRLDLAQIRRWCAACGTTLPAFVAAVEERLKPLARRRAGDEPAKSKKTKA